MTVVARPVRTPRSVRPAAVGNSERGRATRPDDRGDVVQVALRLVCG
ncbi:hypothetical protein Ae406Ps2_0644c [Pseudonocardia sp. Ae406_Ps2]|nr:hypothetical protein Ae406Ps2_0644c [Pseudonocardia sp. Ae406_Ps2]OLM07566.1 hypothetical protein Ae331Ps2_5276 [Pseudonocardia sp. Ae331_Ps2]OLM14753.1 hypothetical protein Ae505Ps2_4884 [Pseudonocardia sp. Ae505_Ps2]OLM22216.1 hypothetical protein Ae706Ps2_0648c [Pseudonocardia sp. Ae706_Ps2]